MARTHDELVRGLVRTRALALGRLAPRGNRVTATGGAAFTTAVRVVDRVHDDAANVRTLAAPYGATSLTVVDVAMVGVRHGANGGEARSMHEALLTGVQAKD